VVPTLFCIFSFYKASSIREILTKGFNTELVLPSQFSRSWFRSEVASDLRNLIRELLLELFGNARVDDIMSEAAASDGKDEECIIKEGESEVVAPCDSSGMAAGGGDTSTRNEEDFMEVRSSEGTPLTTRSSDGRTVACALSEAAMSSDSIDEDDNMKTDLDRSKTEQGVEILPSDGSGMPVGGGGSSTRTEEDFMEVGSLEGTPLTTRSSGGRIITCALSEAATLSDGVDDDDNMKADSDSSKTEEQCIVILSSDRSKNNEKVMHSTPDRTMYCSDSDVEEVKTPEVEKRRRRDELCCIV
jgi:ubiquitin-like-specific protease 1C/D